MREYKFDVPEETTIDNAFIQTQILMMNRKIVDYVYEQGYEIHIKKAVMIEDIFTPEEVIFFKTFHDEILAEFIHKMSTINYYPEDIMSEGCWYDKYDHHIHMNLFYNVPEKEKRRYTLINDIDAVFCVLCFLSFCVYIFDFLFTVCMGFDVSRTVELVRILSAGLTIFSLCSAIFFGDKINKYDDTWGPEITKHFVDTGIEETEEE